MESENENRPLLHSFERETWRSSMRKRCLRIPTEVTITGIILGLFLVVVTLLIVFENLESSHKSELTLENNLQGSPMKFNKKAEDKTWQDKKDSMKNKKKDNIHKWHNVDKGWKKIQDPSGIISREKTEGVFENREFTMEDTDIPGIDEYGKEVDDSLESLIEQEWIVDNALKNVDSDETELMNLLNSPRLKWKKIDDGWKVLSDQGWQDSDIKATLVQTLKEKAFSGKQDDVMQSPMKDDVEDIWDQIVASWKKNLEKRVKEKEKQKEISDEWKNKVNILQSPKTSDSKWKKVDDGWKTLNGKGGKYNQIKEAFLKALKIKDSTPEQGGVLHSPTKMDDFWNEITDKWNKVFNKVNLGKEEQEKQQNINDEFKNKMNVLQSPKAVDKKRIKNDAGWKKLSDQGWKKKEIENALIEAWREKERENEEEKLLQSPAGLQDLWGETINMLKNLIVKGSGNAQSQMNINDEWANKMSAFQSPKSFKDGEKDDGWKILSEQGWKTTEIKEALIKIRLIIKHLQKEQNPKMKSTTDTSITTNLPLQSSKSLDQMNWKTMDDGWKKLSNQGWTDKEIREALYKAWKDGDKLLQSSMGHNSMKWKKVDAGWKKISNKSVGVTTRCPISKQHQQLLLGSAMSAPPVDCALITEEVRRKFGKCIDMSFLPKTCKPSWRIKCFSAYKYRKLDGTCNNKIHPTWGKGGTPFIRMIAPDYGDGVSSLRTAENGDLLPNPRFLSRMLYSKRIKPDSDTSVLFLYFGLIVDHDMVETAVNSDAIPCCLDEFQKQLQTRPRECLQIDVPSDDPFYGPRNVTCLNLVRSVPVNGECAGRREQLNLATSFLDGSAVYGSVIKQAKQLRTFSRGQLQTQLINNTPFMSPAEGAGYSCGTPKEPLKCFEAGDSRVNMMVELTAMHTLWYREHNRIAMELHKLNPKWIDEMLFQEARRILIGELQHITYNEFLPLLLGKEAIDQYELKIDPSKLYNGYDDTVDPSVFNVFAAAAFRFGHSLVPDMQYLVGPGNATPDKVALHETFFNAEILYHNGLDLLLRGAASQRTQTVDSYITNEVREHLFQPADLDYGHDLAAVGIQRGRDHGLPSYTKWREACGLSEVKSWDDLYRVMDETRADVFKKVYQSVEDIDLIPGALAEHHVEGSLVGPTYNCLIGRQFKKTRKGDRFWYEIQNEIGSLTKGQLDQIYKSSMARIICDNSDNMKTIQRHPFKVPSDNNPVLDCSAIPKVDLSEWRASLPY